MKSFVASLLALALTASISSCSSSHYAFPVGTGAYSGSRSVAVASSAVAGSVQVVPPAAAEADDPTAGATASVAAPSPVLPLNERRAAAPRFATPSPVAAPSRPAAPALAATAAPEDARPQLSRKAERQTLRQQAKAAKASTASGHSQLVAALLCFTAGPLGLHDFYLGYTGKGIAQILLSLVFVGFVLALVDLVRILRGTIKPKGTDYEKKL